MPELPSVFLGCWQGDPGAFDSSGGGFGFLGAPGKIVFCYSARSITVPEAEVRITPVGHVADWIEHLCLGYRSFKAHGISTDIYSITPTRIHGRTQLSVTATDHWLYFIPVLRRDVALSPQLQRPL
jgi:hypothetical protein